MTRKAEQLLAGAIDADESEILRVLDKDHVGDVFDHRVQEVIGCADLGGSLRDFDLELARGHLLVAHELRDGDRPPRAVGKDLQKLDVLLA